MSKVPNLQNKTKKNLTKDDYTFLKEFTYTHNRVKAITAAGMQYHKTTGEVISDRRMEEKANKILRNPEAQQYIAKLQEEVFKSNVRDINRTIEEAYKNYEELKEKKSFHEMNIAFIHYCNLLGFSGNQGKTTINQQIVSSSDQPIQITYITPEEFKKDKDE